MLLKLVTDDRVSQRSGVPRVGHGPRAQALQGAPAQLVGANFNGADAMGPELSRGPISLGVFFVLKTFFFFLLVDFFPMGQMQDLPNGGGRRFKHWPPGAGDPRDATEST